MIAPTRMLACVDCVHLIANGEGDTLHIKLMSAHCASQEMNAAHLVMACSAECEGCLTFSRSACETCGRSEAGERHYVAELREDDPR